MERFKVGIIGAGHIARKMAHTLRDMEGVEPYAVASRNQENAEGFACEWGFTRAYGSYEDLADDPEVQLIYIATPHSHHFEQARMCLEKGKPVLCEKAFTCFGWSGCCVYRCGGLCARCKAWYFKPVYGQRGRKNDEYYFVHSDKEEFV